MIKTGETSIEMGGQVRPLKFGTNATAIFCELHDLALADVGEAFKKLTMTQLRDLIYGCAASGHRLRIKTEPDFTPFDVGDWLDEEGVFEQCVEFINRTNQQKVTEKPTGKAKPKR